MPEVNLNYIRENLGSAEYFLAMLLYCIDREVKNAEAPDRTTLNSVRAKVVAASTRIEGAIKKLEGVAK